ncbi:hypothetical protein [Sinomicrobium sp. M5D2P17]
MNTKYYIFVFVLLWTVLPAGAQCAMCRAVLESGEGQEAARGINNGIIYLMAVPYILMGILGYFVYRKFRSK